MEKRKQTPGEELSNWVSHGITALAAFAGSIIVILAAIPSNVEWSLFSALLYSLSLVALYTFSTLYHSITQVNAKKIFKILDHCGIFLLIAGTYTPVVLISIGGKVGWIFFTIQWSMALIGIGLKVFFTGKYNLLSTLLYAVMGWIIVFKIDLVKEVLPPPAFWLLVFGGIAYTVGIVFYILDTRMKFAHFIWHLFVMAGSILHFIMIARYIFK